VGKTYRKIPTGKPRKKKQQKWKNFRIKQEIQLELKDYENETEVSELPKDFSQADS